MSLRASNGLALHPSLYPQLTRPGQKPLPLTSVLLPGCHSEVLRVQPQHTLRWCSSHCTRDLSAQQLRQKSTWSAVSGSEDPAPGLARQAAGWPPRPHTRHAQPGAGWGGQQANVNMGLLSWALSDPVSARLTPQPRGPGQGLRGGARLHVAHGPGSP